MVTYQVESVYDIGEEVRTIGRATWDEVKYEPLSDFEFANNDQAYYVMEDSNMLRVITARDGDVLAGYVIIVVQPLMHHANNTMAHEAGYYVHPEYRKAMIGSKLIDEAEKLCKDAGVNVIAFTVTKTLDYSALLERKGFDEVERTLMKRLN